jgi:hypothetical protein
MCPKQVNIINIFIVAPSISLTDSYLDFRFKMSLEEIPSTWTMLWQIVLFMVVG